MQSSLQSFTRTCIGLNTFVVGPIKAFLPEEHIIQLLKNKFRNVAEYHIVYRVLYNKALYYSEEYNPVKKKKLLHMYKQEWHLSDKIFFTVFN